MRRLATIAVLMLGAPIVYAEDSEDAEITRVAKEHYKLGLEAFKAGKCTDAIKELKRAYSLKRLAPLLINIAKTYEKLGDIDSEIYYYKKYLAEAPDAKDRDQVEQALADAEAAKKGHSTTPEEAPEAAPPPRAAKKVPPAEEAGSPDAVPPVEEAHPAKKPLPTPAESPAPPPKPPEPPPPAPAVVAPVNVWSHAPIDAAPPGQPVDVRVQTPVMKGVKVFLYFRAAGQAEYRSLLMKRRGGEKVARIPGAAMAGRSIQYYIEAKDPAGMLVNHSGSEGDPNIVIIDPGVVPQFAGAETGGEEPSEVVEPPVEKALPPPPEPVHRKKLDEERAPLIGEGEEAPPRERQGPKGPMFTRRAAIIGAVMGGVALVGLTVGITGAALAQIYANTVFDHAGHTLPGPQPGSQIPDLYTFNGTYPNGEPNDLDYQNMGKTWALISPIGFGLAGAAAIAGAVVLALDYKALHPSPPVRHKRPPRLRKPAPIEDGAPASSSLQHFIATPMVGPQTVGLRAGFSF